MGSHRYAGRILETHLNSFRPTLLWLHILHVFFGPDWFLTGRALVFCPVENPVTLGVRAGKQVR